ncbi:hypothetical protein [Chromobacterium vaccinii]|uniref:hypothetical protein n=1 Tax=Chromobacterium vaccinii TaxID=1108595 RepID=UPI0021B241EC|nr:hypothetical protein [Chromobacterium vaccinii]
MQDLKPINSPDSLFHDGNPATGELGTIVAAEWLNGVQSAAQELLTVIKNSGQTPDSTRQDQLLQAVRNIAWGGNSKPTTLGGYGIAIASQAEAEAGTDNVKAMTPLRVEQALNAAGLSGYAKTSIAARCKPCVPTASTMSTATWSAAPRTKTTACCWPTSSATNGAARSTGCGAAPLTNSGCKTATGSPGSSC